jgi:hypothetical protein
MPLLSQPAFGPRTAIIYITIGALLDVWTAVWYFAFAGDQEGHISRNTWFWLAGLFLTGITLITIGILLGNIGRSARKAELPPEEAERDEATIQQTAAATPHPVVTGAVPGQAVPMAGTTMPGAAPATPALPPPAAPPPAPQFVPGVTRR